MGWYVNDVNDVNDWCLVCVSWDVDAIYCKLIGNLMGIS